LGIEERFESGAPAGARTRGVKEGAIMGRPFDQFREPAAHWHMLRGLCLAVGLALLGPALTAGPALARNGQAGKAGVQGAPSGGGAGGAAMDHSKHGMTAAADQGMDHSQMDHSKMDHSAMDQSMHRMGRMIMGAPGMVMNFNEDTPPRDCKNGVSEDVHFTVHVGRKYAKPGQSFGYDVNEWKVKPCARVKVTLVNEDKVRHQWMMHGLPRYLYPQAMFHLEVAGGHTLSGTFIVPSNDETLLVHCDVAQHMEKGLKGQLAIGKGAGDLPSVPGISDARIRDQTAQKGGGWQMAILLGGVLIGVGVGGGLLRRRKT